MKFFALLLFMGELLAPSLMASFEATASDGNATTSYQASVSHASTLFSETDSEERDQDDKHFTATFISFALSFFSVRPFEESQNVFKALATSPRPLKSLFALHSSLRI